jgi:serine/threonine protein kinase
VFFSILGKPQQNEWPENTLSISWESFGNTQKMDFKDIIPNLNDNACDLLTVGLFFVHLSYLICVANFQKMLTFDPKQRISTLDALNHIYFTEEPM